MKKPRLGTNDWGTDDRGDEQDFFRASRPLSLPGGDCDTENGTPMRMKLAPPSDRYWG